jgi:hypothetical protein
MNDLVLKGISLCKNGRVAKIQWNVELEEKTVVEEKDSFNTFLLTSWC